MGSLWHLILFTISGIFDNIIRSTFQPGQQKKLFYSLNPLL